MLLRIFEEKEFGNDERNFEFLFWFIWDFELSFGGFRRFGFIGGKAFDFWSDLRGLTLALEPWL